MMNTRFNPTVNGRLHVGHLYLVLLNYHTAKNSGGQFTVRFDDDQPHWRIAIGEDGMDRFAIAVKEDLEWLGIVPDAYTSERESRSLNEEFICGRLPRPQAILNDREVDDFTTFRYQPKVKTHSCPYPYTSYLTAVKVAQDHREGVDTLLRGDDLVDEFSLYCYLCDLADVPKPAFFYVPRMLRNGGICGAAELTNVSKTIGGCALYEYRNAGWNPEDVIAMLAESALIDSAKGWTYENIKKNPIVQNMP